MLIIMKENNYDRKKVVKSLQIVLHIFIIPWRSFLNKMRKIVKIKRINKNENRLATKRIEKFGGILVSME